ncbi:hypothetical protein A1507_18775 [Methylomonas koyamae]|uniref:Uncharacterized protein n=1 Tax=Methylomonas koyamae TaxID=702114 RepID=A0A177N4R6_9GAMM|nr:hypothetical protein [Methylomonas koyamae]OAI12811.1 hypothetical protein A1507_18775 [Methylomonas koyamae]
MPENLKITKTEMRQAVSVKQTVVAAALALEKIDLESIGLSASDTKTVAQAAKILCKINSLFPSPPTFAAENAEIASKQAQIAAITGTNTRPKDRLEQDIFMLNAQKSMKTATYARELSKPERTMTAAQFSTLYPAPTHATDLSTISTAQTEANKLDAFLKSGPYPNPGAYDVDLLSGTTVSYP